MPNTQEFPTAVIPSLRTAAPPSLDTDVFPVAMVRDPFLTVRSDSSQRTFSPDRDIVVGRDPQADVRIASRLASRAHLLLRCHGGRWVATDNASLNGIFVDGRRMASVDISDTQCITIGDPNGPRLSLSIGRQTGSAQSPPTLVSQRVAQPSGRVNSHRTRPAGAVSVGRASDNDIVVADVLASRHHATIVPTDGGLEIRDAGTINGTFVNGVRTEAAALHEGDVVTIGNLDLVCTGGTLVGRSNTTGAASTGGLQIQ